MTYPALALQQAVVTALAASAPLAAIVGTRIYDAPPRDAAFPYVSFGQLSVADWSTGTESGAEHQLTLDVWSREAGKRECYAILDAVTAALNDAALTLDGNALVNLRFQFADVRRDPDGITFHGVIRFRAVTEAG
jgi:hypothetical protein